MTPALAWLGRRWRWYVALVFLALVAGCCYFVRGALIAGEERRASRARIEASATEAKDLAAQVKRQNDLILSVTGPEAQARSAAGTRDILLRNAIETDCRSRRQQVRLPAPDPARPCADQTDPSVYPGVTGQPERGSP